MGAIVAAETKGFDALARNPLSSLRLEAVERRCYCQALIEHARKGKLMGKNLNMGAA